MQNIVNNLKGGWDCCEEKAIVPYFNMEKKLLVMDLDGTLLRDDKTISDYTLNIFSHLDRSKVKICLASGRCEQMMKIYADLLKSDYVISSNGAVVKKWDSQQLTRHITLEPKTLYDIVKFLKYNKINYMMYSAEKMYCSSYTEEFKKRFRAYENICHLMGKEEKLECINLEEYKEELPENIVKLVAYEKDKDKMTLFQSMLESEFAEKVACESTGYGLLNVAAYNVSKEIAVESVREFYKIEKKNTYIFGDYSNDLSMFSCGDNKIAVANAQEEVKLKATEIILSNNEDGIAHYIKQKNI
ncbi:hypothetical protein CS063_14635 [Sporanaerobium hydrogeniformans]|uniref:Uncharacterized protein n=1 Tax=Sporanaerobium hydrogeniformans TaxID=3072179 RepID=A0AC61DAA1_9FIRM|nr:HAD family hydrolase [Sporanaerobium hydrogeniformans]PHV69656.1 hypothetical protein CS063_14635 [Sporanaerobium hydrogeniformans]